MGGVLIILGIGPGATIQDAGRYGFNRFGVTPAGPMDWAAFAVANRMLSNEPRAAALEIGPGGGRFAVDRPVLLAVAGGGFEWSRDEQRLPSAACFVLRPGESLTARASGWGAFAYIAVPGGIDVPQVMGSRATHTRSGIGGLDGRFLRSGDELAAAADRELVDDVALAASWLARSDDTIRVVLGPQDDHFSAATIEAFQQVDYTLTAAADRMAYKFEGPKLNHAGDFNIVSDGIALGAVQVAGDGQPMVLMADRQPTGGYAKIAHVCRADIGRLAQMRPGESCRFEAVTAQVARAALLELEDRIAETQRFLKPLRRTPTAERLFAVNLVSGVIDGRES